MDLRFSRAFAMQTPPGRLFKRCPIQLPVQADRAQVRRSRELIVGDVVDLERAGVDVAQDEIGGAGCMDRRNARVLPVEADGSQK